MLSPTLSSSISNRISPNEAEELGIPDLEVQHLEEVSPLSDELTDTGTLFADILDTFSDYSPDTNIDMSSESDDDILDFLASKKLSKRKARPPHGPRAKRTHKLFNSHIDENGHTVLELNFDDQRDFKDIKDSKVVDNDLKEAKSSLNKNALNARLQRERKKQYISTLEDKVNGLETENKNLRYVVSERTNQVDKMRNEIQYLKSVIANHTSLSSLLSNIPFSKDMQFGSSISSLVDRQNQSKQVAGCEGPSRRQSKVEDTDSSLGPITRSSHKKGVYVVTTAKVPKVQKYESLLNPLKEGPMCSKTLSAEDEQTTAGVCLHVSQNKVSLEFCASCASNAANIVSGDHCYVKLPQCEC